KLGTQMMDYWISFATSLNPNDGLGSARASCSAYMPELQARAFRSLILFDKYREKEIGFTNAHPQLFRH
ncbi:hypothetical protein B0H19DRAFT_918525, partial [Mycena capillaripes]